MFLLYISIDSKSGDTPIPVPYRKDQRPVHVVVSTFHSVYAYFAVHISMAYGIVTSYRSWPNFLGKFDERYQGAIRHDVYDNCLLL
jgi:hypothetical protein